MKITLELNPISALHSPSTIDGELTPYIARIAGVPESAIINYTILRKSIDARKKPHVVFLYRVTAELLSGTIPQKEVAPAKEPEPFKPFERVGNLRNPIVVGAGPAGLFAAYVLALAGTDPIVLERGRDVERRCDDIARFRACGDLNPESNYLFGEGGAGTWSDGKLYTRVHDPAVAYVLRVFVENGADPSIEYFAHPHLGSDRLPGIIQNLRQRIIALGGEFRWDCRVRDVVVRNGACRGVVLANGETLLSPVVIAGAGHGARDFALALVRQGVPFSMKGFQLGVRAEHLQSYINHCQYGMDCPPEVLGAAEYHLSSSPSKDGKTGGAATFCMCPGGEIIAAVNEMDHLCTNGMSLSARDGKFGNAALITTIPAGTFNTPIEAFDFLDTLECKLAKSGGGKWRAPVQSITDFMNGNIGKPPHETSYCFGLTPARIDTILPQQIVAAIRRCVASCQRSMPDFAHHGYLIGGETHVSMPFRFDRDRITFKSGMPNLYLCGEGAGMAGGIVSAAIDGLYCARAALAEQY